MPDPMPHVVRERDRLQTEDSSLAQAAIAFLQAQPDLFTPTTSLAKFLNINAVKLGNVLRSNKSLFQTEETYIKGKKTVVVALRPGLRSSSSSGA